MLASLSAWTTEERAEARVVVLVALGGTGKTAVAERLVSGLGEGPRPGGTFVWSFYEDPRVEGFLAQALRYFARRASASSVSRRCSGEGRLTFWCWTGWR